LKLCFYIEIQGMTGEAMSKKKSVENDVYERYGLKWADFPTLITPSAHSDEAELFCAKQAMAVYGVYPNTPPDLDHDYVPSRNREAIEAGAFAVARMIEGPGDAPSPSFEGEQGYRQLVSDKAGVLMVWRNDHLVIAFRGTANWQDWIHNFATSRIAPDLIGFDEELELHKGFTGLAENIAPAVDEVIDEFIKMRSSAKLPPIITLCGHSLGGALALNFAARLCRWDGFHSRHVLNNYPIRIGATYTFGAPRIGKGRIWRYIRRPHYRLIVNGDPVPRTPPFCTDDYEAAYLEKPSKEANQPEGALSKILKAKLTILKKSFDFSAHDIENYIDAIQSKINTKVGS
jgi:hypothetical protein